MANRTCFVCKTRWRIAPSAAEGEEVPCWLMCAVGGAWTYRLAQSLCNKRGEVLSTRQPWGTGRGKGKVPNHPAFACPVRAQMWTGGAKKKRGVPCLVAAVFKVVGISTHHCTLLLAFSGVGSESTAQVARKQDSQVSSRDKP